MQQNHLVLMKLIAVFFQPFHLLEEQKKLILLGPFSLKILFWSHCGVHLALKYRCGYTVDLNFSLVGVSSQCLTSTILILSSHSVTILFYTLSEYLKGESYSTKMDYQTGRRNITIFSSSNYIINKNAFNTSTLIISQFSLIIHLHLFKQIKTAYQRHNVPFRPLCPPSPTCVFLLVEMT